MRCTLPILALAAMLALPIACTQQGDAAPAPEPAAAPVETVPVAFRLTVTGKAGAVLAQDGKGQVSLWRKGEKEPLAVTFESGVTTVQPLPPGRYSVAAIGPLACRGLEFEAGPSTPRDLGALRAEIVETDYFVALMSARRATEAELADLARETGAAADSIDAQPLHLAETAPCYLSKNGPGETWHDRPLGEKILIGVGIAAFCAMALASGGFCAF